MSQFVRRIDDDPGTVAFVVVVKRVGGDCPKLSKVADDRIYHSLDDARAAHGALTEASRASFEIRPILAYFCENVEP